MINQIELRICRKCNLEKEIDKYTYHSASDYYSRICIDCENFARRERYKNKIEASGGIYDSTHAVDKKKVCAKCGIEKKLNIEYFPKVGSSYAKVCQDCYNVKDRRKIIIEDIGKSKICKTCKENKELSEYHFSKKGFYYGSCRECVKSRNKNRIIKLDKNSLKEYKERKKLQTLKNKPGQLKSSYSMYDRKRFLDNNLDTEFIEKCLSEDCLYCGYLSSGLDRKDNKLGHTKENCVPCCHQCNTTRMHNYTHEEMLELGPHIKRIKDKRKDKCTN